ncbi:MAG TPA: glycoside hydrolase family 3 N-terminal domain-containing protein [Gemmatimonadaceae bacterium]|nr:glycoside hydrolase family 3 N-terminal domain-containing protein [Gemmatimonadaceae bacterium]
MGNVAELLVPVVRWDATTGFDAERGRIARALELGVGGFVLKGGPEAEVRGLIKDLRQASKIPLLLGAELERGVGQQFIGTTGLPPLAAIVALNDANLVQRAAKLTAREARPLGVNWGFAPMCDLQMNPSNVRTAMDGIGAGADDVGATASHWIEACQHEGMLACAKHFPGAGRVGDPIGNGVPSVDVPRSILFEHEFKPFRAAISSRVASMLVAHVSYPSLDASEAPATFSSVILRYLLREKYGFEGLVASDVLQARTPLSPEDEADIAMRALDAGCDVLLGPSRLEQLVETLERCVRDGPLYEDRIEQSRRRRLKWAQWAAPQTDFRRVSGSDVAWALQLSERVITMSRGAAPKLPKAIEVVIVDDDPACPPLHQRTAFAQALESAQTIAPVIDAPSQGRDAPVYVAVFGELRDDRSELRYRPETLERIAQACEEATRQRREAVIVLFAPPVLASQIGGNAPIVCAWSGDRCMQEAAARWLLKGGV